MDWTLTLLSDVYDDLTANDTLLTLMGGNPAQRGEWIFEDLAETDAKFPYLVHAFEEGSIDGCWAFAGGRYTIDVWVQVPIEEDGGLLDMSQTRVRAIREAIVARLEQRTFTNSVYGWARFSQAPGAKSLPTDNENIQHYTIPFDVRYSRARVIDQVLAR